MGPLCKWVDDHILFRIPLLYLETYNEMRRTWRQEIKEHGGRIYNGSRIWFCGKNMPDGKPEEFDEDCDFPLRDLSKSSPRSDEDLLYSYNDNDIDGLSSHLGIVWEHSKSTSFQSVTQFFGFSWDLDDRTVSVPEQKKKKYLDAIAEWETRSTHSLLEVQQLYGKLLHISLVVPAGRAYLTNLEAMLGTFNHCPFVPHTPPRDTPFDLRWWKHLLQSPSVSRPIPKPTLIIDCEAYSDASSGVGIAITVGEKWRAWKLLPGWKSNGREIQ